MLTGQRVNPVSGPHVSAHGPFWSVAAAQWTVGPTCRHMGPFGQWRLLNGQWAPIRPDGPKQAMATRGPSACSLEVGVTEGSVWESDPVRRVPSVCLDTSATCSVKCPQELAGAGGESGERILVCLCLSHAHACVQAKERVRVCGRACSRVRRNAAQ